MAGMSLLRSKLESYVTQASEALEFKMVRQRTDIDDSSAIFHPEFTHQVFGDNESIFGYKDLQVQLYYSAGSLTTYLGMQYSEKIDSRKFEGVEPDNVVIQIADKLQPGFLSNLDDFILKLEKDANFIPHGTKLDVFISKSDNNVGRQFEIYQTDISAPGFKDYHERLQTFVLWYIDGASFIDIDDERWKFFTVYEKFAADCESQYAFVGYASIYHYYAYPNRIRPRISQLLILPPFQKLGIGTHMLQTIYNAYLHDGNILNITVEEPSEGFTRLRDFVDTRNCLKLSNFQNPKLEAGFTEEMAVEAQTQLKLNKKQARRVYEILRLHATDRQDKEQYRMYRLEVKRRLNLPFQKQQADLAKLQKTLKPEELRATLNHTSQDQRLEQLEHQYRELETEYQHVLERLAASDLGT